MEILFLRVKKHGGALQNFFDILKDVAKGPKILKISQIIGKVHRIFSKRVTEKWMRTKWKRDLTKLFYEVFLNLNTDSFGDVPQKQLYEETNRKNVTLWSGAH